MKRVGISDPEMRLDQYPHHLSGGMRQRVVIAIAIACDPIILIADEPTTALDVTVQAEILNLINELKDEYQTAVLFITHDFGVISKVANKIAVMYLGKIVEFGDKDEIFSNPSHPYTKGLLDSIPKIDRSRSEKINSIPGIVPSHTRELNGCYFYNRCTKGIDLCKSRYPQFKTELSKTHYANCHLLKEKSL